MSARLRLGNGGTRTRESRHDSLLFLIVAVPSLALFSSCLVTDRVPVPAAVSPALVATGRRTRSGRGTSSHRNTSSRTRRRTRTKRRLKEKDQQEQRLRQSFPTCGLVPPHPCLWIQCQSPTDRRFQTRKQLKRRTRSQNCRFELSPRTRWTSSTCPLIRRCRRRSHTSASRCRVQHCQPLRHPH